MSSSNCCFLTCIQVSQEEAQVLWYSHLFQNFSQFIVINIVKSLGIVNKVEIDVFLELSCFFDDPTCFDDPNVGNLISGSSAFPKSNLNIWKLMVHVLLKPGLENFEHYFTSMWKWSSLSRVWLFVTPWTIQSMGFSRPEYWSGQPFPSPGNLCDPGLEPRSPALQAYSLPPEPQGKPKNTGAGSLSLLRQIFLT